jgi:hypothetical protein
MKGMSGWKRAEVKWWLKCARIKRGSRPEIRPRNFGFLMVSFPSSYPFLDLVKRVAERVGFEPTVALRLHTLSRRA